MTSNWTSLEEQIEADFNENLIPGMALVASRQGEVLFEKYAGYRNVAERKPVTADTVFGLASLTKSVVAVAVMMLQDKGKLSSSDHVVKWLPELKMWNQFYKKNITIHHLLTHTAGLPGMGAFHLARRTSIEMDPDGVYLFGRFTGEDYVYNVRDLITAMIEENAPFIAGPGEMFNYSNEGYALLQEIIERASGADFADFIDVNVFQPLGMTGSTFTFADWQDFDNVTELYAFSKDIPKQVFHTPAWWGSSYIYGAGAMKSTVVDIQRYLELFRQHGTIDGKTLVSPASMAAMTTKHITTPNGVSYGYGLIVATYRGRRVIGHGGGIKGVSSFMLVGADDVTVTVLMNIADVAAESFAMTVLDACWEAEIEESTDEKKRSEESELTATELAIYAGHYETNERQTVDVSVKGQALQLQMKEQHIDVKPCGNHQFLLPDGKRITFIMDETGSVKGIFRGMRYIQKRRSEENGDDYK